MDRARRTAGLLWVALGLMVQLVQAARGVVPGPVTALLIVVTVSLAAATALRHRRPRVAWFVGWVTAALLGLDFLGAVADRFGVFGGAASPGVSWGSWPAFVDYTRVLLPDAVAYAAPGAAALATLVEIGLAGWLLSGWQRRWAGKAAAGLLVVYLVTMATALGWASVAQFAVPVLAGGALLVSATPARLRPTPNGAPGPAVQLA